VGFLKWLLESSQKRGAQRYLNCRVVAYYWNGAASTAHTVKDISYLGAYLITEERWYVGTMLMLTLQPEPEITDSAAAITIPCRVVRHGLDGVGVHFLLSGSKEHQTVREFVRAVTGSKRGARSGTSGQAVVEFALMVPLLFLLIVNAFNFGSFIYCWLTVSDATRAAADYACTDSNTAGAPATPSVSLITSLVQNGTSGLPNYTSSNPAVTVCTYNNGTTTSFNSTSACPTGVTAPPSDPEPVASGSTTHYSTVAVDVTYTFTPLLAGSTFLRFGLPSLPSTIHRRVVVRWP
jgi:Flp pilus assembly protein TadG